MIFILVLLSSSWAVSSRTVTVGYLLHAEDYLMALRGAVCFVTVGQGAQGHCPAVSTSLVLARCWTTGTALAAGQTPVVELALLLLPERV